MFGTYLGCQSDLQASQDHHYLMTSVDNYFCLHIHVSYFSVKTGSDGVQLISCCKKRRKTGGGKKKKVFVGQGSTIDLVKPKSSQFNNVQQNPSTEKGMCQIAAKWNINESATSLLYLNKQEKDFPSSSTFDIYFIIQNALMLS